MNDQVNSLSKPFRYSQARRRRRLLVAFIPGIILLPIIVGCVEWWKTILEFCSEWKEAYTIKD